MIKLTPNPDNPRQVTKEKVDRLIKKIKAFPEMLEKRPIVYDENKIILGGNTKYKSLEILEKEGFEIKDSYFSDASGWTEDQKKNFIINDNLHEGDWDYEILANEWNVEQLTDWGVTIKDWEHNILDNANTEVNTDVLTEDLDIECPRCHFRFKSDNDGTSRTSGL